MSETDRTKIGQDDYTARLRELIEQRNEELLKTREGQKVVELFDPVFDEDKSFWDRLLAFLKAENKLGKEVGKYLDEHASEEVNDAREFVKKHVLPRL